MKRMKRIEKVRNEKVLNSKGKQNNIGRNFEEEWRLDGTTKGKVNNFIRGKAILTNLCLRAQLKLLDEVNSGGYKRTQEMVCDRKQLETLVVNGIC